MLKLKKKIKKAQTIIRCCNIIILVMKFKSLSLFIWCSNLNFLEENQLSFVKTQSKHTKFKCFQKEQMLKIVKFIMLKIQKDKKLIF